MRQGTYSWVDEIRAIDAGSQTTESTIPIGHTDVGYIAVLRVAVGVAVGRAADEAGHGGVATRR